jgi:hypothetical protein
MTVLGTKVCPVALLSSPLLSCPVLSCPVLSLIRAEPYQVHAGIACRKQPAERGRGGAGRVSEGKQHQPRDQGRPTAITMQAVVGEQEILGGQAAFLVSAL